MRPDAHRGTCRSCGAAIRWAVTPKGHRIPLDDAPSATGNVELGQPLREGGPPLARVLGAVSAADTRALAGLIAVGPVLYTPHHATCPQGRAWRRSAKASTR